MRPTAAQLLSHPFLHAAPDQYSTQVLNDALAEFKVSTYLNMAYLGGCIYMP